MTKRTAKMELVTWSRLIVSLAVLHVGLCTWPYNELDISANHLDYPTDFRMLLTRTGSVRPENMIATRFQMFVDNVFVALPRYKPGIPFTLAKTSTLSKHKNVTLTPFPDCNIQCIRDERLLHSVVDIFLDDRNTLWALDEGTVNTFTDPTYLREPKIFGFNVLDSTLTHEVSLDGLVTDSSQLQYLVVSRSFTKNLEETIMLYISDASTSSILVTNLDGSYTNKITLQAFSKTRKSTKNHSCKNKSPLFEITPCPENDRTISTTALYMAPVKIEDRKVLLVSALGDPVLQGIDITNAKDEELIVIGEKPEGRDMILLGTDKFRNVYFRYFGNNQLLKWNTKEPFQDSSITGVTDSDEDDDSESYEEETSSQVVYQDVLHSWTLNVPMREYLEGEIPSNGAFTTKLRKIRTG